MLGDPRYSLPLSSVCRSSGVQSAVSVCFWSERLFISRFLEEEKKCKQEEDAASRYEEQTAVISRRGLLSCYRTHQCFLSAPGEGPRCMKPAILSIISYTNVVVTHKANGMFKRYNIDAFCRQLDGVKREPSDDMLTFVWLMIVKAQDNDCFPYLFFFSCKYTKEHMKGKRRDGSASSRLFLTPCLHCLLDTGSSVSAGAMRKGALCS